MRAGLAGRLGERGFQIVYSIVAIATFVMIVQAYRGMPPEPPLWAVDDPLWILASLLVLIASILFIGSLIGNPALPAPNAAAAARAEPRGVFAITRHPMMWGFALWAAVHLTVLAAPKAMVFDGAILVLALFGAAGQDRKKAAHMGEAWHEWTAQTAFIPFSRGVGNPGAVALIGGTLLFLIATWAHPVPAGIWRWVA